MGIRELDHIVLNVADIERSLAWYTDRLGLDPVRVDEWRAGDAPFPSVRVSAGCIIDLFAADGATPADRNLNHFCLRADRADIHAIAADDRFTVFDGPVVRFGARGDGWSVYVTDPDDNVVEIRSYE